MTNFAAMTRRAASAVTLLLLLIAPPLLLASAVGWPLPTTTPTLSAIEDAARTGISDTVVVKVLATLAWLAWLQIAASALLEITSIIRHRPAPHLPVLPGLQPAMTRLVAAALLVTATAARPAPSGAAPLQPQAPIEASQAPPPAPILAAANAPADLPQPAVRTITVERHDSYWAIAERTLGDGFRWREIRDLNAGRTMSDGTVLAAGSDLLHPGWTLQLPAEQSAIVDLTAPITPPLVANGVEVAVERGDGFWDIATEHVEAELGRPATDDEIRPYWSALVDANRDRLADADDPNLLFTGQVLTLVGPPPPPVAPSPPVAEPQGPPDEPPAPTPPSTTLPPSTLPPTTEAPVADEPSAAPSADPSDDLADGDTLDPITAASAGFTALLAVGAARHLALRRRRRAHLRLVADDPTPDEAVDTHRDLLHAADAPAIDDLHGQLTALAQALAAAGAAARPLVVQHSPDHLDIYLDTPLEALPGWIAHPTNSALWTADPPNQPPIEADTPCPAPLLVTLGPPDGGGQLYLDLEAHPLVAVTGDPSAATDLMRSIAAELALSPLRDTLDLILVGDVALGDLADLDHVRRSDRWDGILDELTTWAEQTHVALTTNGWPNAFIGRAGAPDHDALGPVAVLADGPPPPELLDVLVSNPRAVLAVVALGTVPGALDLHCTVDSLSIPMLGLDIDPVQLSEATLADLLELLDDPEPDAGTSAPFVAPQLDLDDVRIEPEPEIVVRLLGDITVDASDLKLSTKQTAVLSYIAIHGPVASDRVENAIWAGDASPARRKRLSNTVSDLRALVGRNHLPAAAEGHYEVGSLVATDLELFERLVRRAAMQPADQAADTLRSALDLVRGPVFTYRTAERASYTWVDLENLVSRWELRVAAVAERCATLLLDHGRVDEAVDAATHALSILPTHPALTEVLMRAHAANGDRLAVQRVYQAHVASLTQLELDDVAESTSELYERLASNTG